MLICRFTWWPWRQTQSRGLSYVVYLQACGDDDCRRLVVTEPTARIIIVAADNTSFVPQKCNRCCFSFSDPSPNYTPRTQEEPITREVLGSMLSNRGSPVRLALGYKTAVVLPQTGQKKKNLRTHGKLSYSLEPWSACVELVTLLLSLHSVCASRRHDLGSFLTWRQQEASEFRRLVTTLSPLLG